MWVVKTWSRTAFECFIKPAILKQYIDDLANDSYDLFLRTEICASFWHFYIENGFTGSYWWQVHVGDTFQRQLFSKHARNRYTTFPYF